MSKFDKFLEEDEPLEQPQKSPSPVERSVPTGDAISIKIKTSTMAQLRLLKTLEGHRSYAQTIEHLINHYVTQADDSLRAKLAILER